MFLKIIILFFVFNSLTDSVFVNCNDNVVNTTSGSVRGQTIHVFGQNIEQYLGIPYAEPPLGSLRFAKPKPISKPIGGIIDATKAKYSCPQIVSPAFKEFFGDLTVGEDCLTLNIWAPKNSTKLKPVMFWIYGGGFSMGSIYQPMYNGTVLASNDIVLVAVNYRVGVFGFLYSGNESAPGSAGFYDQLLGLKWVRDNIHLFGGDKNQITIFGESAGSFSVSAHLLSPLSKGLFKRAILQSGALLSSTSSTLFSYFSSKLEGLKFARHVADKVNCTNNSTWFQCLQNVNYTKLIPLSAMFTFPIEGSSFLPLGAQRAFKENKFNKDLDIMAGVTKDEGSSLALSMKPEIISKNLTKDDFNNFVKNEINGVFHSGVDPAQMEKFYLNNTNGNDSRAIRWKIFDILGDVCLKCPTYHFARQYAEHSSPKTNVYFYELTHLAQDMMKGLDLGVYHGSDTPLVFGSAILTPGLLSKENIEFVKYTQKLWTDFAKYGKPDNNWPKLIYSERHSSVTQIKDLNPNNSHKYFNNLFDKTCDGFLKDYFINK